MLTQNLTNLIETGQAQFRNWVTGATGSSRIPVPKNNYVVITGFHFFHFGDIDPLSQEATIDQLMRNTMHQIMFRSYGQEYFYGVRSSFLRSITSTGLEMAIPTQPETFFDCYQVHKTDVHVDIWRYPKPKDWVGGSFTRLNDKTTEPPSPSGYGTFPIGVPALNVQTEVNFGAGTFYPYGEQSGFTLTGGWQENFRTGITNLTALFPPAQGDNSAQYTFPLVDISYVLVNHPFEKVNR